MAVFYGNSSTNNKYIGRLEVWESATNIVANTSTISWTFKIYRNDSYSSYNRNTGNHFTLKVDGSSQYTSSSFSVNMNGATSEGSATQIANGSFPVDHDDDGAKHF
jgi:hypothetical protein